MNRRWMIASYVYIIHLTVCKLWQTSTVLNLFFTIPAVLDGSRGHVFSVLLKLGDRNYPILGK